MEDEPLVALNLSESLAELESKRYADILASKNIPFAFITGYGTSALASKYADAPVLQKPIDQQALQNLLVQRHPSLAMA